MINNYPIALLLDSYFYFCIKMKLSIWSILKNKYFIATLVFIVWVGFFDQNNFIHQQTLRGELNKIKKERQFYIDEIHKDTKMYLEIISSDERMEKYAREKYLMKRENEDVFLIVYE